MTKILKGLAVASAVFFSMTSSAAQAIDIKPGLWSFQGETWLNGKSLSEAVRQMRDKAPPAQRQFYPDLSAPSQECVSPEESKVDPRVFFEGEPDEEDPRKCVASNEKLLAAKYESDFECKTQKGEKSRGHVSIDFSPTSWRAELKGQGKYAAMPPEAAAAMGVSADAGTGSDMEFRVLSSGKFIGATCTPASKKQSSVK